ncbi:xanthine dehydrogenase family protein molybdopterin-binding subunit [Rhodoplanes sp. Z2-YC6860]|uniref:xanthine dehydrogenase family protein molybdopterin-binding subunit n=1 Tax=Rhodoplanes sp. Z2-YC6860 TaxID=674703 RepID=UPI00078DCB19|nr:xanthine dehydrogenase family protein molybdopterin-binding subunit [Rhodoplanes sp. Z2-YC6860]AMN39472.1 carbon monoxide dehydrogenase large subunit [Rhodoplanes sp. Z2-YC6860]
MAEHSQLIGRRMVRVEDGPLLRGQGRFVDDLPMPDALHVAFLRSPVAHGRLKSVDDSATKTQPGVHAVLTFADLRPLLTSDRIPQSLPSGAIRFHVDPQALVKDEVTYVGEPIAMVVAQSRRLAEDALTSVAFDIEPLPAVTDPVDGLEPGAPKARLDCPDNLVARQSIDYGDIDAAFAKAAHRVKDRFRLHKGGGHSIETRGIAVRPDPIDDTLTIYANTQMPHRAKQILVAALGVPESRIRVVAPDSGGGFGPKAAFHPEELALPAAAMLLGKPLKWMEDRRENFVAAVGERDQDWDMDAAFDADGRLLALRGRLCHDHGSCTPYGVAMAYNAGTNVIGPYVLPAYRLDINWCLTNFVPSAPTRGAGRPQGMFVMERMLDAIAHKLDLPRDEIRRRNMIQPSQMPYPTPIKQRDGSTMTYDSGDYPECQRRALDAAGWADFPARQAAARREGRYIGLGLANYVEATGRGPFESATLRVGASGKIVVTSGASAQGQGTKSMLAQLVGDVLNVAPDSITVVAGDTAGTAMGFGAFASRQAVTAGNAVHRAAVEVREKALKAAAEMLEASADDLELKDGAVQVKGVPQLRKTLAEIAHAIGGVPGFGLPNGITPGLASAVDFPAPALTYCNGSHVCEAEVDPETGAVALRNYVVVHDSGRIINPMIVDGQVIGAVAHGIGATLYEWMRFDGEGQPQTVTYGDYLLPSTDTVPRIEVVHMETPTPLNPLGVKGAAESGTISAPAAIISAVEDALRPFGVRIRDLPLTPERLLKAIRDGR